MSLSKYTHSFRLITLLSCSLLLVVVLAACGGGGSTSTSTPTATTKPSPTPSPTSAVSLTTYTGNGFTIGYPQGWKVTSNSSEISITDPTQENDLSIVTVSNPNGAASTSTILNSTVNAVKTSMKNSQTLNVAPTTMIGGDSWTQKSIAGTTTINGQSTIVQIVFASDNHPANSSLTKNFTIFYGSPQTMFSTVNSTDFQPMLQSFKFTS